jgi:hypothetical protein
MSWYTFARSKDDPARYDASQDLFTTMYLTHGLPQGMALWIKPNCDTGENMLFAQVPDGLNVKDSAFFRMFSLTQCSGPSMAGLSLLVGKAGGAR